MSFAQDLRASGRTPAVDAMPRPGAQRTLAAVGLNHALHDGYTDLIYVLLPVWQAEFALGYAALALLRTLYNGALAALQMPSARLAARSARGGCSCSGPAERRRLCAGRPFGEPGRPLPRPDPRGHRQQHPASPGLRGDRPRLRPLGPRAAGHLQLHGRPREGQRAAPARPAAVADGLALGALADRRPGRRRGARPPAPAPA